MKLAGLIVILSLMLLSILAVIYVKIPEFLWYLLGAVALILFIKWKWPMLLINKKYWY